MFDFSDKYSQGMAAEVAAGRDSCCPGKRACGIEQNELFERYRAHPDDKGRNRAQPIEKPKRQDHRRLKAT